MRNKLLTNFDFIKGCNDVIRNTLIQYSAQLREQQMTQDLSCEQFGSAKYDISYILLHDVLLMEARSFVMKYEAAKNRKSNCRKLEIEDEIDRIQNSQVDKDTVRVETLKNELQKLEDTREEENARRYFAKNNLEGERPTKFFLLVKQEIEE